METPAGSIKSLFDHVESYTKTTFELLKLKMLEKLITVVTSMVSQLTALVVISLGVLVLSIGVALWLGELLGKSYYGFFVVAGFYLVMGIVFHFFLRKWLRRPVSNFIIKQSFNKETYATS
ncbi:MAG TPA: phage holin family protein [Saprospiraceae bacterium]|nr:phage holin family protein [Saprospiraceae bacterium]